MYNVIVQKRYIHVLNRGICSVSLFLIGQPEDHLLEISNAASQPSLFFLLQLYNLLLAVLLHVIHVFLLRVYLNELRYCRAAGSSP